MNIIPVPGKSFMQMPFRNMLRSPWRSLLTVMGIAIAILLMTVFIGFLDTFVLTLDRAEDAYLSQEPDRLVVLMDFFYPTDGEQVTAVENMTTADGQPLFAQVDTALAVGGRLLGADEEFDVSLELLDMNGGLWKPDLLKGQIDGRVSRVLSSRKKRRMT